MNALMALELIAIGKTYDFDVFRKTPWYIFFMVIFMTSTAYLAMACFFCTLAFNKNQAFTINFCVILMSMVMNIVLSEPSVIKKVFFNLDMPPWVNIANRVFYFLPCFQFGKLFSDITSVTCFHFDVENLNWVSSERDFMVDDVWTIREGIFFTKDRFRVDSMMYTIMTLVNVILFYGSFAWYFDNTLSHNRGVPKDMFFVFRLSYWFPYIFGDSEHDNREYLQSTSLLPNEQSERKEIIALEKAGDTKDVNGLRCMGLSKKYKSIIQGNEIQALNDVFFSI